MCENVKKVLEGNKDPLCTVNMDGETHESTDFVCVIAKDTGDAALFYNTDALTLGMAMRMTARAFVEAMSKLPEEEQKAITSVLGASNIREEHEDE